MRFRIKLPSLISSQTNIDSVEMEFDHNLTYREVLLKLSDSFQGDLRRRLFDSKTDLSVILIVYNKTVFPDEEVKNGDNLVLMYPLLG